MQQRDDEPEFLAGEPSLEPIKRDWLVDAADLLAEPDPGPTPWLVDGLIVDHAIVAAVGRWKTTKSYALLDVSIAIATGRPAFGVFEVPTPGPVVFVNEESGRAALWRRLDALCRGRAIDPQELRGSLLVSANERIKLDDRDWLQRLLDLADELRPRLFVFDPLARMKAAGLDENKQTDMAVVIESARTLRDDTAAAVCFVHHVGHGGGNMRGSSDLESVWETRLTWTRDGQSPQVDLESEHREAEAGPTFRYRVAWDAATRSMRFNPADDGLPPLRDRIVEWLTEHGSGKTEDVAKGVQVRRADVQRTLEELETAGTTHRGPSGRRDRAGRPIRDKVWNLSNQPELWPVPETRTDQDEPRDGHRGSVARPPSLEGDARDEPPDEPPEDPSEDEIERLADLARELEAKATP